MADELVPMRQAMGEAYLGDTIMAKQLFASPATFDQRVISLLSGLGQAAETPTAQAISGDNIKAVMAALDLTDNAKRVALLQKILTPVTIPAIDYTDKSPNSDAFVARFNFDDINYEYTGFSDASAFLVSFRLVRFSPYSARLYIRSLYHPSALPPPSASSRFLRSISVCFRHDLIPGLPAQISSFAGAFISNSDDFGVYPSPADVLLFVESGSGAPYFGHHPRPFLSSYRRVSSPTDPSSPVDHMSPVFCAYTFEGIFVPPNAYPFPERSYVLISVACDFTSSTAIY